MKEVLELPSSAYRTNKIGTRVRWQLFHVSGARGLQSEDPSDVIARTVLQATWRLYLHSLYSDDILQLLGRDLSNSEFVGVFVIFSCLCVHAYVHGFLNPINLGKFYWTAPLMCYVIGLSSKVGAVLKSRISTKEKGQAKRPTIQDQNTGPITAICYETSIKEYPLHSIRHRISVSS